MSLRTILAASVLATGVLAAPVAEAQMPVHIPSIQRRGPARTEMIGDGAQLYAVRHTGPIADINQASEILRLPPMGSQQFCGTNTTFIDYSDGRMTFSGDFPINNCLPFSGPSAGCSPTLVAGDGEHIAMVLEGYINITAPLASSGVTFAFHHDEGFSFRIGTVNVSSFPGRTPARLTTQFVTFETEGIYPYTLIYFENEDVATLEWSFHPGNVPYDRSSFTLVGPFLFQSGTLGCGPTCMRCTDPRPRCWTGGATPTCVECLVTPDCPEGSTCSADRRCVPIPCREDRDCGPGAFCSMNMCRRCDVDDRCGPTCRRCSGDTPRCNPELFDCAQCANDTHCNPGQRCVTGRCTGGCNNDSECNPGQRCINNRCVGCTDDTQCNPGQICVEGVCTDRPVDAGVDAGDAGDAGPDMDSDVRDGGMDADAGPPQGVVLAGGPCSVRMGSRAHPAALWLLGAAAALGMVRRRRNRRAN